MTKPKIYFLIGPTASGKTAVSIALAKRMNAEIISADSIQIYSGMDIGSAKPSEEEKQGVAHHMIDVISPTERDFSVAVYRKAALSCISDIQARGKHPLVVGGTGLYVNALIYPLDFPTTPPNDALRSLWHSRELIQKGSAHNRLAEIDQQSAHRLHPNDIKRVIRAIEVCEGTGKTLGELGANFTRRDDAALPYHPIMAGLAMPREFLYQRIEQRVDAMLEAGLVDEVNALLTAGVNPASSAMQGLGYKQIASYIRGACSTQEAVETIKRETRRFAKRQLTWFRREERIRWFDATQYKTLPDLTDEIFNYFSEV